MQSLRRILLRAMSIGSIGIAGSSDPVDGATNGPYSKE